MTAPAVMQGNSLALHHLVRPAAGGEKAPPLLLLLHGIGSDERDLAQLAPALDSRLVVVTARAPIRLDRGFAWYHMDYTAGGPVAHEREAEESRQLVSAFLREAAGAYGADTSRLYIGGFSQGAIMSLSVALVEPERVAGVVAMSGRLLAQVLPRVAPEERLAGLPILVVHGTEDNVLPIAYGRDIRDQLAKLPVKLAYHEYPMGHQISMESLRTVQSWLATELATPARRRGPG